MVEYVLKRDGEVQEYSREKIAEAIFKAVKACGGNDRARCDELAKEVEDIICRSFDEKKRPTVEQIQDTVEKVLIENRHAQVAKSYILYREKRASAREHNALVGATINMFNTYLEDDDMAIRNNANMAKSVSGLNNFAREEFTKYYWLNEVYTHDIKLAHENGDIYLHDLGFFGAYCAGWDIMQILTKGFNGAKGKVSSSPPKHLRSMLGMIINCTFTTQGETAGAQAWSSFDTYCAPFVRADGLNFKQVKQCLQEFLFNLNVPTRVGFQTPFSNITLDIKVPKTLADKPVIVGGVPQETTYADYQAEMDMINLAFCELMCEGDALGQVFPFPIPTINITKEFDWNSPVADAIMDMTAKYGIPYFANYVNSDLSPEDAVSMCCRLRLDVRELKRRGGGFFGSNPLTGSIGVVTLNLPRLGYLTKNEDEFFKRLEELSDLAMRSLEMKRKVVETQSDRGLYPYSCFYLSDVKKRSGGYWANHFNTIGVVGMNECLLNFMEKDITTKEGHAFAIKVLDFLREKMSYYQEQTGNIYNLEATPAEAVAPKLARNDLKRFPDIIHAGSKENPIYTNSTQLPVEYTDDIFKTIELQDDLQSRYTGGTVLHLYLGEKIEDKDTIKTLIKKVFEKNKMPYISITPTFSICQKHGYISGEHFTCPECGEKTEVWSRVVGFLRRIEDFNNGKREEYMRRTKYKIKKEQLV